MESLTQGDPALLFVNCTIPLILEQEFTCDQNREHVQCPVVKDGLVSSRAACKQGICTGVDAA